MYVHLYLHYNFTLQYYRPLVIWLLQKYYKNVTSEIRVFQREK